MKQPYEMTLEEFLKSRTYRTQTGGPAPFQPGEIGGLEKSHWTCLADKSHPDRLLKSLLGESTRFYEDEQYHNARHGFPVRAYQAANPENSTIIPGTWVTLSKSVADDHLAHDLKGYGAVLTQYVDPRHLFVPSFHKHIQEFVYAPDDLHTWHRGVALDARKQGKEIHPDLEKSLPPVPDDQVKEIESWRQARKTPRAVIDLRSK